MINEIDKIELEFPNGLLGFENCNHFMLEKSEYEPFYWLSSEDDKNLSFLVLDPFICFHDYEVDVEDSVLSQIDIKSPDDVLVLTIITIPGNGKNITANLEGPIMINKKNHLALQAILTDPRWTTKHEIIPGSVKGGK
ncbi:MAG: flagellar assembly protein FliW [Treponemataceae bacterium]|nr:flagellar assembly protein FliW [Spirochaetales bacterium]MDY6030160.1 flagellar assembly protein FliW [Treponemataceae bacterium]